MSRKRSDGLRGKWALVTGASSGLGLEFATLLAAQNASLVLVARPTDLLEQLAERLRSMHRVHGETRVRETFSAVVESGEVA